MARRVRDESRWLRLDLLIDRQLNPELFEAVSKIKDGRRRADFLRGCAEKYLVMPKAPQWVPAGGVTFPQSLDKPQEMAPSLSSQGAVSHMARDSRDDGSSRIAGRASVPPSPAPTQSQSSPQSAGVRQNESPSLTAIAPERHKRPGAAALARALPGGTPGLG